MKTRFSLAVFVALLAAILSAWLGYVAAQWGFNVLMSFGGPRTIFQVLSFTPFGLLILWAANGLALAAAAVLGGLTYVVVRRLLGASAMLRPRFATILLSAFFLSMAIGLVFLFARAVRGT